MTDLMIYIKALQKVHNELSDLIINKVCERQVRLEFNISTKRPSLDLWIFKTELHDEYAMDQTCVYFAHRDLDHNLKNVADFKQRAENLINAYLKSD